jgi:anti-anti-sigma factor
MSQDHFLSFERVGDVTIATVLLPELTSSVTDTLLGLLREPMEVGQATRLVLDLSRVKFMDSVALGTLVVLLRRIKQSEGRLALVGLSGHCLKVVEVTGLNRVFEVYQDVAGAMEGMKRPGP